MSGHISPRGWFFGFKLFGKQVGVGMDGDGSGWPKWVPWVKVID